MAASLLSSLASLSLIAHNQDGSVDMDTTALQVQVALAAELEAARANDQAFECALDRLFDSRPEGRSIPTDFAVQTAATEVAAGDVDKVLELIPLCEAFVKRSPRFEAKRGRNGGLFRVG